MIVLTKHAEEAVEQRRLSRDWIERTIAMPDVAYPDPDDAALIRSFKAIDEAGGRILRVVHRPDGDNIVIITAHFDRGAKR